MTETKPRSRLAQRRSEAKINPAFHEAGHAVVALWCGHALKPKGNAVTIRGYRKKGDVAGLSSYRGRCRIIWNPPYIASELSRAAVFLAGALAEHTMLGTAYAYGDDEVVEVAIMNEEILRDLAPDDLCRAISIIRQIRGMDHVDVILSDIRKIEAVTVEILGRADVRRSIETVADRLLQHNALTVGMVIECLAPDVMHGGLALTGTFQAALKDS